MGSRTTNNGDRELYCYSQVSLNESAFTPACREFWAASPNSPGVLCKLDCCLQEIDRIQLTLPNGRVGSITGLSCDCISNQLVISTSELFLFSNKCGESCVFHHRQQPKELFLAVCSGMPFVFFLENMGGKQYIKMLDSNGELMEEEVCIPDEYLALNVILCPDTDPSGCRHLNVFAFKYECYPYIIDICLDGCLSEQILPCPCPCGGDDTLCLCDFHSCRDSDCGYCDLIGEVFELIRDLRLSGEIDGRITLNLADGHILREKPETEVRISNADILPDENSGLVRRELYRLAMYYKSKADQNEKVIKLLKEIAEHMDSGDECGMRELYQSFIECSLVNECNELGLYSMIEEIKSKIYQT